MREIASVYASFQLVMFHDVSKIKVFLTGRSFKSPSSVATWVANRKIERNYHLNLESRPNVGCALTRAMRRILIASKGWFRPKI
jgi:hypothetical protein